MDLHLLWIFMCSFRLHFWLKRLPHMSQRNGFSPVWILLCLSKCPARSKHLPQYGQMKPFLNINLFTVLLRTVLYRLRYCPEPSSPRPNVPCWKPLEPLQGGASPAFREDWGRHSKEFCCKLKTSELLPPGWLCVLRFHCRLSPSYKTGGSGWTIASSFVSSTGSHLTCTSGIDKMFGSLSDRIFSGKALSSPTSVRGAVETQKLRCRTAYEIQNLVNSQ